jgi:hypothetical protein
MVAKAAFTQIAEPAVAAVVAVTGKLAGEPIPETEDSPCPSCSSSNNEALMVVTSVKVKEVESRSPRNHKVLWK